MFLRVSAPLCLLLGAAFGQSGEKLKFEVADVHASPKHIQPFSRGPFYTSGRYEVRFMTMLDLIRVAYNVDPERVTGGPPWLELDRYDVFAKAPERSNAEGRRQMLQSLLAERFHLKTHEGKAPLPAWALTAKKELKPSDGEGESGCKFIPPAGGGPQPGGGPIQIPMLGWVCKNVTMAAFAEQLMNAPAAQQYFGSRLVVDQSELKGSYDIAVQYTPKVPAGIQVQGEQVSLFQAVEKAGLKLEMATAPVPTIIVDGVERTPTPNSEEAMKSFPPLPSEFEVASLKPSAPDSRGGQPDIKNGRLYLPGFPLQTLMLVAWDLGGTEFLVNAPKWLNEDRYDILAKAPAGVAIGDLAPNRNSVPVNIDALRPMLRALLKERFQLEVHEEDRPIDAYRLVANKPKLKQADGKARTRWFEGTNVTNEKNANAALGRLVTCENVTMQQFAEMLPLIAPGYLRTNVVDATGLEGGYDFTFSFSPQGAIQQARAQVEGENDSVNGISLPDALNKQLGLKLETVKRPTRMLVIDKIERKPLEN